MPEFGGKGATMADRVLIVQSETGSGKSTVLPVHVFRILRSEVAPRGQRYVGPSVLCTQPRVLTAIDLASRQVGGSAHYPDMRLGETVGYQTGPFSEKPAAGLIFATIGVLAAQLKTMEDAEIMSRYRFIIVDEAHERSKEADVTLLRLKNFFMRNLGNDKLPFLILASATIELAKYSSFFNVGKENTVHVVGRSYRIEDHWPDRGTNNYPRDCALKAISIHEEKSDDPPDRGDVLIFVPGNSEIESAREVLEQKNAVYSSTDHGPPPFLILAINREAIEEKSPEYKLISEKSSNLPKVGRRKPSRRIIISTVVAETGLTIETLRYVIDAGWSRSREAYQPYGAVGLITRPAPQSRIKQRKGRVGRVFPGDFYPMYTENVYESLDSQQLPDIATGGMGEVLLDIVGEQQRQKARLGQVGEFRVEDIDLLGSAPVDALFSALGRGVSLGFISKTAHLPLATQAELLGERVNGYGLSQIGILASRFSRVSLEAARSIFASRVWGVSTRDMITAAAVADTPLESMMDFAYVAAAKGSIIKTRAALKDSLPTFISQRVGGSESSDETLVKPLRGVLIPPTEEEAFFYRARLLLADDFVEALLVLDEFMSRLEKSDGEVVHVIDWAVSVGLDVARVMEVLARREEVVEDMLAAGLDPFWGDELRLSRTSMKDFISRLVGIKRCLYDGYRHNLLHYNSDENVYEDRFGLKVEVPPMFTDNELRKLSAVGIGSLRKPQFIIVAAIELAAAKPERKTTQKSLMYRPRAKTVSVMDGFVDIDLDFARPQTEICLDKKESPKRDAGLHHGRRDTSSPESRIHSYIKLCRAAFPSICPPIFQIPSSGLEFLFAGKRLDDLVRNPFSHRGCVVRSE